MRKDHVFMFWGFMDLTYVLWIVYGSLSRGRVPLYDDVVSFLQLDAQHGWNMLVWWFVASMSLTVTVVVTMVLFFNKCPVARVIAYFQVPFRLFFVVPSLSFILWLLGAFGVRQVTLVIAILLICEALKVFSLYRVGSARVQED